MKNKVLTVFLAVACVLVFFYSCSQKVVEEKESIYEIIKMERMVQ